MTFHGQKAFFKKYREKILLYIGLSAIYNVKTHNIGWIGAKTGNYFLGFVKIFGVDKRGMGVYTNCV